MSKGTQYLQNVIKGKARRKGIPSLCSSNKYVLRAVLEYAKKHNEFVLIESTANQVNQYGGYTDMKPIDFKNYVYGLADEIGIRKENIILGGDHLGPVVFKDKDEEEAMSESEELIREYVKAGYEKIHIDTSMKLASDRKDKILSDETIARRGARLCSVAEEAFEEAFGKKSDLVYVVGSEVPVPGGTTLGDDELHVTSPEDFRRTKEAFESAFMEKNIESVFSRVIAFVVQPGVEFSDDKIDEYNSEKAEKLIGELKKNTGLAFEGHSTDYQTAEKLKEMVLDGVRILKVGPELTYALREGLFAIDYMLEQFIEMGGFVEAIEKAMMDNPANWEKYYSGTEFEKKIKRKFSYSDRWRYYANEPEVEGAVIKMFNDFEDCDMPLNILSQFMPSQYGKVRNGEFAMKAEVLVEDKVKEVLDKYYSAVQ